MGLPVIMTVAHTDHISPVKGHSVLRRTARSVGAATWVATAVVCLPLSRGVCLAAHRSSNRQQRGQEPIFGRVFKRKATERRSMYGLKVGIGGRVDDSSEPKGSVYLIMKESDPKVHS